LNNSVNRSIADEVFVATDSKTNQDVGFITVKRKTDSLVNIGLLAVDSNFRRRGIARKLLARATLWANEVLNYEKTGILQVVTQGANKTACSCYESYGFLPVSVQDVYHVWLPQHLIEPLSRSDQAKLPFCKQYFTGKEAEYVAQVFTTGLDSASR
jgi:predicted GNAT family acetyltransferase